MWTIAALGLLAGCSDPLKEVELVTEARVLGDLKDPKDPIHEFLRTHKVQVLKPQMATGSKTYYNGLDGSVR